MKTTQKEIERLLEETLERPTGILSLVQAVRLLAEVVDLIAKRVDALTLFHTPLVEELKETDETYQVSELRPKA